MREGAAWQSPDMAFYMAAGCLGLTLIAFVALTRREDH
jgi:hypothetical protein